MEPHGLLGLAAVPVGGGRAWPGFEMTRRSPAAWRAPVEPEGLLGQTAVPVGGGRAWPGFEMTRRSPAAWRAPVEAHGLLGLAAVPVGGGRAWPGFEIDHSEPQARVWRSRGRAAAHGRTTQPDSARPPTGVNDQTSS